jgi:hypothetical protein
MTPEQIKDAETITQLSFKYQFDDFVKVLTLGLEGARDDWNEDSGQHQELNRVIREVKEIEDNMHDYPN